MIARYLSLLVLACSAPFAMGASSTPAVAQQPSDGFQFALDEAQRQANWDTVTAEIAAADRNMAGMAQDIRNLLRSQNIIDPYMAGYGLSSANLGDVLALAQFSAVILADGGRTDDPTQAQIDGVRAAIGRAAGPDLAALPNSQKQELADRLLFLVVLQSAVAEALAGQPALDAWLNAFAETNSAMLGFDVTQVRIGPKGFVSSPPPSSPSAADGLAAGPSQVSVPAGSNAGSMGSGRSEILGIGFENRMIFVPGFSGGSLQQVNTLTVLLRNGQACVDCLSDVLEGNLAAAAARDPRDMGRWRKNGQTYLITFDDGDTKEFEAGDLHGPAPQGTTLNGNFKGVSGTSIGIANTLTIDFLNFRPDGSFLADGSTSSVGAYAIAAVDRAAQSGRYTIDGYRIVFDYANGAREESSFVLYDRDDEFIIIDEVPHYIPDDD